MLPSYRSGKTSVRKRITAAVAVVASLSVVLAACSSTSSSSSSPGGATKSPIQIGMSDPLSGPVGPICGPDSTGAQAWLTQVNNQGGVNGHPVNLSVLDDSYDATLAVSNARTFEQNNALAILGGCGATPAAAILQYANTVGIPYLFPFAGNPLTLGADSFALYPYYTLQLPPLIKSEFARLGPGKTYLVSLNTAGATTTSAAIQDAITKNGGTVVGDDYIVNTTTDYTPEALKIKAAQPDYIVMVLGYTQAGQLITSLRQQSALPTKEFLAVSSVLNAAFITAVGAQTAGSVVEASPTPGPDSAKGKTCDDALKAANVALTDISLWGCVEAQVLVSALKQIKGPITRAALVKTIEGWHNQSVSPVIGTVSFSKTNHTGLSEVYSVGVKNGLIVTNKLLK